MPNSSCAIRDNLGVLSVPLGLGYIASYLRNQGHEVQIHDGLLQRTVDTKFLQLLEAFQPDVVGISGQATPTIQDVYHTANLVKQFDSKVLVVVGGAHVTFQDFQVLNKCPEIDVVVRGEGEITMSKLLDDYASKGHYLDVRGITLRLNTSTVRNPDMPYIENLDTLPFPAYDLLNLPNYFGPDLPVATMITSRGCPYGCIFCSSSRIVGKKWRGRSPGNVVNEIRFLEQNFGVREIEFVDDLFTFNYRRVHAICEQMQSDGCQVGWTCSTRADIMARHPEMAKWLKDAGCHTVYVGAESGSQRVLNYLRKGITLKQVMQTVKTLNDAGLRSIVSFVTGIPSETKEEIQTTIDFACQLNPDLAQFTVCTPYPGTPLYEVANENGWLAKLKWRDFSVLKPVMNLPGLSKQIIQNCLYKAYLKFYTRPKYVWKQLRMGNLPLFKVVIQNILRFVKDLRLL
ncbi:MAG: B12-binding domain-containing radical SAM protein [Candidatus Thorarchaeota archaeon]